VKSHIYVRSKYKNHRSRTEIAAQILQAANGHDEITKTKIMYKAFLTYAQLQEYLAILIQNGLLEYLSGTKSYKTTEKGLRFLKIYEKMEEELTMIDTKLPEGQNNK
jgi:predicted transcriptional regulator